MASPTVVEIPHTLGRDEAKRRMNARIGDLAGRIPGGAATVESSWPSPDRMIVTVTTMGQSIPSAIDVEDRLVRVSVTLPFMLSFLAGPITAIVRKSGEEALLADHSDETS